MINKTIYILLITTSLFAQIQKGGLPEFYNESSISIDYILVDSKEVIDRDFHPMVFQFGYEYEFNLDIKKINYIRNEIKSISLVNKDEQRAFGRYLERRSSESSFLEKEFEKVV